MKSFKFIHCADLHLDSPFEGICALEPDIAKILRNATFMAFKNVIDLAIREEVDFLIIAGDVYNGVDRSLRAQLQFRDGIVRAAENGIQCFIAHGNHDPLSGWEAGLAMPNGVYRFRGKHVEDVEVKRNGSILAHVYGISYEVKDIRKNLVSMFNKKDDGRFSIGILHCNVGGDPNHDNYAPCSVIDLAKCGLDYWALGHIHTRKVIMDIDPCIIYSGNTQGLNVKETGARGCYLVEVNTAGKINTKFIATDIVRWSTKQVDITGLSTLDELLDSLHEFIESVRASAEDRALILRILLKGRGDLHNELRRIELVKDIALQLREGEIEREDFVWIESISDITRPAIDIVKRRDVEDFIGDFLRLANTLHNSQAAFEEIQSILANRPEYRTIAKQIDHLSESDLLSIVGEAEILGLDRLLISEY